MVAELLELLDMTDTMLAVGAPCGEAPQRLTHINGL